MLDENTHALDVEQSKRCIVPSPMSIDDALYEIIEKMSKDDLVDLVVNTFCSSASKSDFVKSHSKFQEKATQRAVDSIANQFYEIY